MPRLAPALRCLAALALSGFVAACSAPEPSASRLAVVSSGNLPAIKRFSEVPDTPPLRSNVEMAEDFLDLFFMLESGTPLAVMSRFETPVRVAVNGTGPATLDADLAQVLRRFRREAGLDIRRNDRSADPQILINIVPRRQIASLLPNVACFAIPLAVDWEGYKAIRRSPPLDWSRLTKRTHAAIFVPGDVSPQELRDCLHEELAQSLGPLNDLYRLPDSVFNDDNVHSVLTGFDMLMLRVAYDPALSSGMTRSQAAAIVPALLAKMNPDGAGGGADRRPRTPRSWIQALMRSVNPARGAVLQRNSAARMLRIAQTEGWQDHRLGWSHFHYSQFLTDDPRRAVDHLRQAYDIFSASPQTALHRARVAARLASYAVLVNQPQDALALIDANLPAARAGQNAALLATLMLLRAEALDERGDAPAATAQRLDSLGWARYGFGTVEAVRTTAREIATLNPQR